jgi:hypothetical protein
MDFMKLKLLTVVGILLFLATSCTRNNDRLKVDLASVKIPEVKIKRYDKDLFAIPLNDLRNGLAAIQPKYMFFLGTDLNDQAKLSEMSAYLTNPRNIDFHKAVEQKFRDLTGVEKELTEAFRHIRYYFPGMPVPTVYSYISGGDYDNPVELADSVMIIALDTYLGADFKPYLSDGVPLYKALRMTPDQIVPDCMRTVVGKLMPVSMSLNTFLDQIVDAGKRIYLLDAFIPDVPGDLKMDFTPGQFDWIVKNESHVWSAIIENRMLYSSDGQTLRTFLADGPFTPAFGNDSPPRLGEWIGWKIVKSYMNNHPDVTMDQLIREHDSQKILAESGYKPEKN